MSNPTETSDGRLLEWLRQRGAMSVTELADASGVTATAVRQRLTRLMSQGLIGREVARGSRGRPSHRYTLTEKARRQAGNNFADLAIALWEEVRQIKDPEVRRGLLQRLAGTLARTYAGQLGEKSGAGRLEALQQLFADRSVPMTVETTMSGPKLTVVACPYPELAEKDRGICALERLLFSEVLDTPVRLSACRLDGHACCEFETN
jgi:predicted ArsR family transcriptional regulator